MSLPLITFLIAFVAACAYAGGRLHQWYRHALERDEAWRDGYDRASGTLFKLAARNRRRQPGEISTDIPISRKQSAGSVTDIADAPSAGRHSFEIRQQITRRLPVSSSNDREAG